MPNRQINRIHPHLWTTTMLEFSYPDPKGCSKLNILGGCFTAYMGNFVFILYSKYFYQQGNQMRTGFEQTVGQGKEIYLLSPLKCLSLSCLSWINKKRKCYFTSPRTCCPAHFSQANIVFYKAFSIQPILCFSLKEIIPLNVLNSTKLEGHYFMLFKLEE